MPQDRYSAYFEEGFRITATDEGLEIRTTDFHARPLHLGRNELARFGLSLDTGKVELSAIDTDSQALVREILVTLERAIALACDQRPRSAWADDIMNLELAREILGGGGERES